MSNLRHGDYDDVTFALVLLLHSFFAQPPSNPIRRTRLFLLCVCACMCARACVYIYYVQCICVRQNTYSLTIIQQVELVSFSYFLSVYLQSFQHFLTQGNIVHKAEKFDRRQSNLFLYEAKTHTYVFLLLFFCLLLLLLLLLLLSSSFCYI